MDVFLQQLFSLAADTDTVGVVFVTPSGVLSAEMFYLRAKIVIKLVKIPKLLVSSGRVEIVVTACALLK